MRPLLDILGTLAMGVWISLPPSPPATVSTPSVSESPFPSVSSSTVADFQAAATVHGEAPPTIQVLRDSRGITIHFTGVLWSASNPEGPWSIVTGAPTPLPIDPTLAPSRFYRTYRAEPPATAGVFDSDSILAWTLTGPFQSHFELAFAGMPDGIFPPHRDKPYFPGSAHVSGLDLPLSLRVRGNSRLQECPFPKMKLKVSKEDRAGTPFANAREIDIGTHCAEGGSGTVGRLRDERAAYREALAYEIVNDLGFTSPRVRRARIDYHDTTLPDPDLPPETTGGWTLTRQALLIEDAEVVGERLGGRALDDDEIAALRDAHFAPQLLTDLRLLHALFGNWDYALSESGEGLWNTEVIALADGTLIPMAGDFDLASWVTAHVRLNAPHDYRPELPDLEREARFQVDEIRKRAGAMAFAAGRTRFLDRRAALEARVIQAEVDEAGRQNIQNHLAVFFQALE